jgi:hypothetical protein
MIGGKSRIKQDKKRDEARENARKREKIDG